ncbi:hypothetical protein AGMMS49991_02730 [Spirochaetia bacterium]|nr:hypothetical protein AGMMS49991_02730 [Spirochaetia bacterium]
MLPLTLYAQNSDRAMSPSDPAEFVGLTVGDLVARLGLPQSMYAVRGLEEWQDDVVFAYGDREFYFYKDRVWQVGLRTAYGIKVGENRNVIPLIMGDETTVTGDCSLAPLPGKPWSMTVRFNNDKNGLITAIFIYRSDF